MDLKTYNRKNTTENFLLLVNKVIATLNQQTQIKAQET